MVTKEKQKTDACFKFLLDKGTPYHLVSSKLNLLHVQFLSLFVIIAVGSESSSSQQIKKCPAVESKVPIQAVILAAAGAPPPPPAAGRTQTH